MGVYINLLFELRVFIMEENANETPLLKFIKGMIFS
jgi:hypothetical protein